MAILGDEKDEAETRLQAELRREQQDREQEVGTLQEQLSAALTDVLKQSDDLDASRSTLGNTNATISGLDLANATLTDQLADARAEHEREAWGLSESIQALQEELAVSATSQHDATAAHVLQ